jgi:putative addiction module killer protein
MVEVVSYTDESGDNAFDDWLASLDNQAFNKVFAAVVRMQQGNFGDTRSVGDGVLERRVHAGPGYRVYFGRDGAQLVLLLAGGTKRGQDRDIAAAKLLWREYKQRRKGT